MVTPSHGLNEGFILDLAHFHILLFCLFILYGQLPQQVVVLHATSVQDTLIKYAIIKLYIIYIYIYIIIVELTFQQVICYSMSFS